MLPKMTAGVFTGLYIINISVARITGHWGNKTKLRQFIIIIIFL